MPVYPVPLPPELELLLEQLADLRAALVHRDDIETRRALGVILSRPDGDAFVRDLLAIVQERLERERPGVTLLHDTVRPPAAYPVWEPMPGVVDGGMIPRPLYRRPSLLQRIANRLLTQRN